VSRRHGKQHAQLCACGKTGFIRWQRAAGALGRQRSRNLGSERVYWCNIGGLCHITRLNKKEHAQREVARSLGMLWEN